MDADDELARLLPEPPPPRPSRRVAAIAAAMQRFDGSMAPSPTAAIAVRERRPRPTWWQRPTARLGGAMSAMLVAVIGAAIALHTPGGQFEGARGGPPVAPPPAPPAKPGPHDRDGRVAGAAPVAASARSAFTSAPASVGEGAKLDRSIAETPPTDRVERPNLSAPTAPAPAPVAPPPPPAAVAAVEPAPAPAPFARSDPPGRAALAGRAEEPSAGDIVVTGMRVRANRARRSGDWNACTVNDPRQALRKCGRWIGGGANGPGTHISAGLTLAWRGDWAGAADAFGQAIAMKPRSGFAYLNRGLAYQRVGDLARAAADLDRAVGYDGDARSYYNRAILRRERGDEHGAQVDSARAVELDPGYLGVVE